MPKPVPICSRCPRCAINLNPSAKFCPECGLGLIKSSEPRTEPEPPAEPELPAEPEPEPKPEPKTAATLVRSILRRVRRARSDDDDQPLTASGEHRTLIDMDKDELEALATVLEAQRSPVDRWVTRGLIPIMLLVAGPIVTYYFATRADQSIEAVEQTNTEVARLAGTTDKLETLVADAGRQVQAMDEARAEELTALRVVVQRLERALQLTILRDAIHQVALSYAVQDRQKLIAALKRHRGAICKRVQRQTQEQFPHMPEKIAKREVERAFDRYQEQVQGQEQ